MGFNVIDTAYLVDSIGALTILPAAVLLVQANLGAPVIYTSSRVRNTTDEPDPLKHMLCGNVGVMCTLLGIVPVAYLCGVTTRSYHEYTDNTIPITNRITWREKSVGDTI